MVKEFGVSIPFFDKKDRYYQDPREAMRDFIADQNTGAKLSMMFNLESFKELGDGIREFNIKTSCGEEDVQVVVSDLDTFVHSDNEFSLTIHYRDAMEIMSPVYNSVEHKHGNVSVSVTRTGNDFRLDIVQRLG